jgi:hypothetical protein
MTKPERMTKHEYPKTDSAATAQVAGPWEILDIRHSDLVRHSTFVIRI